MALTVAKVSGGDWVSGNKRVRTRDITFDSSYTTTGVALTPAQVGLKTIVAAVPAGLARTGAAGATAAAVSYDYTNNKLQAYVSNGASPALLNEAPNTTNLSTNTARIVFYGF